MVHIADAQMWLQVDLDSPEEQVVFLVIGTGVQIPEHGRVLGTWFAPPFVWHVIRLPDPNVKYVTIASDGRA